MEMELVLPVPPLDFNFDSACSSPYLTAPSSPQRFGNFYFSAPTSPTRSSSFYRQYNDLSLLHDHDVATTSASVIPFDWEEKPGIPKFKGFENGDDFEFNFSGQLDRASLSADELFDGGKIKPLKPPPRLLLNESVVLSNASSPRSPSPRSSKMKMVQEALSPRHRKSGSEFDPFEAALRETRKQGELGQLRSREGEGNRGRERIPSYVRKGSRSLSPLRVSNIAIDTEEISSNTRTASSTTPNHKPSSSTSSSSSSILSSISFSKGYRKWRLKDFLLFRSASEGRATDKDPLRKYSALSKKTTDDVKNSSFRSIDSSGSASGSSRSRGHVSAHELHYTANRAVSEEMKKKTFLPYKQGLLGCLGFRPGMHEISRNIGSLTRG